MFALIPPPLLVEVAPQCCDSRRSLSGATASVAPLLTPVKIPGESSEVARVVLGGARGGPAPVPGALGREARLGQGTDLGRAVVGEHGESRAAALPVLDDP